MAIRKDELRGMGQNCRAPYIGRQDRKRGKGRGKGSGSHGVFVWLAQREAYRPGEFVSRFREMRTRFASKTQVIRKLAAELDKEAESQGQPIRICASTLLNFVRLNYPQITPPKGQTTMQAITEAPDAGRLRLLARNNGLVLAKLCEKENLSYEELLREALDDMSFR